MLDLKILNMDKLSVEKQNAIMRGTYTITEKYDGVKVSLIRNTSDYDKDNYANNWIVAYKGNIIYPSEFEYVDSISDTIGSSQFTALHDLLKSRNHELCDIPRNMEFQVEFIMNKPTLTRNYEKFHVMYLINYSHITSDIKFDFGRVITCPIKSSVSYCDLKTKIYAKALGLQTPRIIIENQILNDQFVDYPRMKEVLLEMPSELGGKMEGVVLRSHDRIWKLVQPDQYDSKIRAQRKNAYRYTDRSRENAYWCKVYSYAKDILSTLFSDTCGIEYMLECIGVSLHTRLGCDDFPVHDKKSVSSVADDIQLTAKTIMLKNLRGNNGVLFSGRFQPLTRAHCNIIVNLLTKYDGVVVNIVNDDKRTANNPFVYEELVDMFGRVFPTVNNLFFQRTKTGNLNTIISKSPININAVVCGSDRYDGYEQQLQKIGSPTLIEIPRNDDISGTSLREQIRNDIFNSKFIVDKLTCDDEYYEFIRDTIKNNS